jgi:hypothetical protein
MAMFTMLGDDEVVGCAYECTCAMGWTKVTGSNGFDTCVTLLGVAIEIQPMTIGCPSGDPCLEKALTAKNTCANDSQASRGYVCSCDGLRGLFKSGPDGNSCLFA